MGNTLYRFVISFSLAHKENCSWLPLLIYVPLIVMSVVAGVYNGIGNIICRIFDLTKLEYNVTYQIVKIVVKSQKSALGSCFVFGAQ